jgi:hydrogenase maturation protease
MSNTVVIGLGNPLLSDEGIGIHLIKELKERYECRGLPLLELGTSAFSVLHAIAGKKKVVIIDCAFMGEKPGSIARFSKEEVRSLKQISGLSLHEGDLLYTLALSENLGEAPEQIVLFGIEPASIALGGGLSETLLANIDRYLALLATELKLKEKIAPAAFS